LKKNRIKNNFNILDEQTNKTTQSRDQMQLPLTKENSNEDLGRNNAQPESRSKSS
jgi:hypothetical protein